MCYRGVVRPVVVYGMKSGVQSSYTFGEFVLSLGLVLAFVHFAFCWICPPRGFPQSLVFVSAWFASALWVLGSAQLLWLRSHDWASNNKWLKVARLTWAVGWLALLVHSALTFDIVHNWSHEAAFRHTRRTSGVGEGLYVNYLVLFVWGLDAAWLAAAPAQYARRPRWVGWTVHGFLAFIVFNATVVYGQEWTQWAGLGWFAILGVSVVRRRLGLPA